MAQEQICACGRVVRVPNPAADGDVLCECGRSPGFPSDRNASEPILADVIREEEATEAPTDTHSTDTHSTDTQATGTAPRETAEACGTSGSEVPVPPVVFPVESEGPPERPSGDGVPGALPAPSIATSRRDSTAGRGASPWAMGLVGMVVLAMAALFIFRDRLLRVPSLPGRAINQTGEVVDAFAGPVLEPEAAEIRGISKTLDRLLESSRNDDTQAMGELLDSERMYQEARRAGAFARITAAQERKVLETIRRKQPPHLIEAFDYDRFELRNCKLSESRQEAVAYVRLWAEDARGDKVRFWLIRANDGWRIYDFEDLVNCLRLSDQTAESTMRVRSLADARRQELLAGKIRQAWTILRSADPARYPDAERILRELDAADLPDSLRAFRWQLQAALEVDLGLPQKALESCKRAEQFRRKLAVLPYLRACAENQLNHFDEAETMARRYIEQIGSDADVEAQLGYALWGQQRFPEAAEAFRRGLRDDPNSFENLFQLGLVLPPDELGELRRHAERMETFAEAFPMFCENYLEQNAAGAFTTLLAYQRTNASEAVETEYYQAYAEQDWPKVIELYEQRIQPVEDRTHLPYRPTLVAAMFQEDRALEAYERIPPAEEVFHQLATLATYSDDAILLRKLIDAHRVRQPDDIQLVYWEADWNFLRENYEEAIDLLTGNHERIMQETELASMLVDRLVRGLIYERRFDEASRQAQQWCNDTGDPWYAALTAATRGDPDATRNWLGHCVEFGYTPFQFHLDPLMGPALKSEQLKEVLDKYPVPWREEAGPTL